MMCLSGLQGYRWHGYSKAPHHVRHWWLKRGSSHATSIITSVMENNLDSSGCSNIYAETSGLFIYKTHTVHFSSEGSAYGKAQQIVNISTKRSYPVNYETKVLCVPQDLKTLQDKLKEINE